MPHDLYIAHHVDGAKEEKVSNSKRTDNENSTVLARSVFISSSPSEIKASDDTMITGYTAQGLPFLLNIDGFFGSDEEQINQMRLMINQKILPRIVQYAADLSKSLNVEEETILAKQMLMDIAPSLEECEFGKIANFTFSLAVVHQHENEQFVSGFGIGDTGIVLKRNDGSISQLAYNSEITETSDDTIYSYKDSWHSCATQQDIDLTIQRNTLFTREPVSPGDQLVAYSYLPDCMASDEEAKTVAHDRLNKRKQGLTENSTPKKLDLDKLNFYLNEAERSMSLFDKIKLACNNWRNRLAEKKEAGEQVRDGDDQTIGFITIPSSDLQSQLVRLIAIQTAAEKYLAWMRSVNVQVNKNGDAYWRPSFNFAHFFHGATGYNRVNVILKMIKNGENIDDIIRVTQQASIKSGSRKHSFNRFLYDELQHPAQSVVGTLSDQEFHDQKRPSLGL